MTHAVRVPWIPDDQQRKFSSLKEFYDFYPARKLYDECDYGCWWSEDTSRAFYRVSYIEGTGDIYAVQLWPEGGVELLAILPPDDGPNFHETLDTILEGWAEECGKPGSLHWVRERLAQAAAREQR